MPFLFRVEIDELATAEEAGVELGRAGEPGLLVNREQQLERPVRHCRRVDEREHRRDADSVVGAERRAGRGEIRAVPLRDDGVGGEVMRDVGVLLLHHVEMRLQDGDRSVAVAGSRGLADDDVAGAVDDSAATGAFGGADHVRAHAPLVLGGARDGEDGVEVRPEGRRVERGDEGHRY